MSDTQTETDFDFYLKFVKPLVLNLSKPDDRVLAAAWIQRLRDENAGDAQLRTDYLKLLLFVLQRKKLIGIFRENPSDHQQLDEFPTANLYDVAKDLLEAENAYRKEKTKGISTAAGDFPPYSTEYSADLMEYSAAQDIPNFGVHAYYAISNEPLPNWERIEKAVFPRGVTSVSERAARSGTPSRTSTAASTPTIDKDRPKSSPDRSKSKPRLRPKTRSRSKSPRGAPSPALGSPPKPDEERPPPTWGSNLIGVPEPPMREFSAEPQLSDFPSETGDSYFLPQPPRLPSGSRTPQQDVSYFEGYGTPSQPYSPQLPGGEADPFFLESPPGNFLVESPPALSPRDEPFTSYTSYRPEYSGLSPKSPSPTTGQVSAISAGSSLYGSVPYRTPSPVPAQFTAESSYYDDLPYRTPSPRIYSPILPSAETDPFFLESPPSFFTAESPPPCSPGVSPYQRDTSPRGQRVGGKEYYLEELKKLGLDESYRPEGSGLPHKFPSPTNGQVSGISAGSSLYGSVPYRTPSPVPARFTAESSFYDDLPYRTPSPRIYSPMLPYGETDPFFLESPPSFFTAESPPPCSPGVSPYQRDISPRGQKVGVKEYDLEELKKLGLDESDLGSDVFKLDDADVFNISDTSNISLQEPSFRRSPADYDLEAFDRMIEEFERDDVTCPVCPPGSSKGPKVLKQPSPPTTIIKTTGPTTSETPGEETYSGTAGAKSPESKTSARGKKTATKGKSATSRQQSQTSVAKKQQQISRRARQIPCLASQVCAPRSPPRGAQTAATKMSGIPVPGGTRIPQVSRIPTAGGSRIPAPSGSRVGLSKGSRSRLPVRGKYPSCASGGQQPCPGSPRTPRSQAAGEPESGATTILTAVSPPRSPFSPKLPTGQMDPFFLETPPNFLEEASLEAISPVQRKSPGIDVNLLKELGLTEDDLKEDVFEIDDLDLGNISQVSAEDIEYEDKPEYNLQDESIEEAFTEWERKIKELETEHAEDIALYGSPDKPASPKRQVSQRTPISPRCTSPGRLNTSMLPLISQGSPVAQEIINEANKLFEESTTSISSVSPNKSLRSFEEVEKEFNEDSFLADIPAYASPLRTPPGLPGFKIAEEMARKQLEQLHKVSPSRRQLSPKRPVATIRVGEGEDMVFEILPYESPPPSGYQRLHFESPPAGYFASPPPPSPPVSPTKLVLSPTVFGLPEVKRFPPLKRAHLPQYDEQQAVAEQQFASPKQRQTPRSPILYGKEAEDIDLYVRPERRELAQRVTQLISDIPDTFEPIHQFKEWDLPKTPGDIGVLEETPPSFGSPEPGSPLSPIYSPSFKRSIQEHQYTEHFFDKDRPLATGIIKSGNRAVRLQRKSRPPSLQHIKEAIQPAYELPKAEYYGSPGRMFVRTPIKPPRIGVDHSTGLFEESPPKGFALSSPGPTTPPSRLFLESPPLEYFGSPGSPLSPEEAAALPAPYDLPKIKRFSPIKRPVTTQIKARENLREVMSKAAQQLEMLGSPPKYSSPTITRDEEDIDLYVQPERRQLAKRARELVSDIPDTFERPHEFKEWDLPVTPAKGGILEETQPFYGSPELGSPLSPIYSPRFKQSIQQHQYTEHFFDKDRPMATNVIKSGSRAVRLQRKSQPPRLTNISEQIYEEPVYELPKADLHASPGRIYKTPPKSRSDEFGGLFSESPPEEGFFSPESLHKTPPRRMESPISSPESPFSLKLRLFQEDEPPYYSLDEMSVLVGKPRTIKRHSAPPNLHKLRELPDEYGEEYVPFLSQVEAAGGQWLNPPRKMKITRPDMDSVMESPVRVPNLLEAEDRTGFRWYTEELERKFADLPPLPTTRPEEGLERAESERTPPRRIPSPGRAPATVPGWSTPPQLKTHSVKRPRWRELPESRGQRVKLIPDIHGIIGDEIPPMEMQYSPPQVSATEMEQLRPKGTKSVTEPSTPERRPPIPYRSDTPDIFSVAAGAETFNIADEPLPDELQYSPISRQPAESPFNLYDELQFSPKYAPTATRQPESPLSSPESPFALKMRLFQGEEPPYYSLDEMHVLVGKGKTIKRHSAAPSLHKLREVPEHYREENVPFLAQVEKAKVEWTRPPRKMRVTAPNVSPVREEPMNVPGMFEVDDLTGFRKVREQLEKRFADLPQLTQEHPDELIGVSSAVEFKKSETELDKPHPEGLRPPITPTAEVPGWRTPPHLRKKLKSPKPYEVKLIPGLRDVLFQEMPPPEMGYSPPAISPPPISPRSVQSELARTPLRKFVTPDRHMAPTPRPSPFLSPISYTPPLIQGKPGDVFKKRGTYLELEMPPEEFMPIGTPPSPEFWERKTNALTAQSSFSPDTTVDSFEAHEMSLLEEDGSKERKIRGRSRQNIISPKRMEAARAASRAAYKQLMELQEQTPPSALRSPEALDEFEALEGMCLDDSLERALPKAFTPAPGPFKRLQEVQVRKKAKKQYEQLQWSPEKSDVEFEKIMIVEQPREEFYGPPTRYEQLEKLVFDVPEPQTPRRRPLVSPKMKKPTPEWSPTLPQVAQFADPIEEELIPRGVWAYRSPETPPQTPPRPKIYQRSSPPQAPERPSSSMRSPRSLREPINLFGVEPAGADYIEQTEAPALVSSPTSPPTPPNILDYYRAHTPPSPDSPTELARALKEHQFTEHHYDKGRRLMTGRLQIKNKSIPIRRRSKRPGFSPIKESYQEISQIRQPPPTGQLIPILPFSESIEIEEVIESEDFPLIDRPVPQIGLGYGMADKVTLDFQSPPKRLRPVIPPKYEYVPSRKSVRRNLFGVTMEPEGRLLDTTPPEDFSSPQLLYSSPEESFRHVSSPGTPTSPLDSSNFRRAVMEHQYTDYFFDSDRPLATGTVISGGRAVRLQRKPPPPNFDYIEEESSNEQFYPPVRGSPNYELPKAEYYGSPGRKYVRTPYKPPRS